MQQSVRTTVEDGRTIRHQQTVKCKYIT
jgi:hypothetical protein